MQEELIYPAGTLDEIAVDILLAFSPKRTVPNLNACNEAQHVVVEACVKRNVAQPLERHRIGRLSMDPTPPIRLFNGETKNNLMDIDHAHTLLPHVTAAPQLS